MQVEQWCPKAQKMTTLTLGSVHKTRIGLEAGTVTACKTQQECRHLHKMNCLIGKILEGRWP